MDFQLVITRGRSASQAVKLADGVTTVGRQTGCQLRIASSQVSRKHCQFFEMKGHLLVKDLGSSNGTYVNGKKVVEQQVLEPGDLLTIGQVQFRVEKAAAAPKVGSRPSDTAVAASAPAGGDVVEIDVDEDSSPTVSAAPKAQPASTDKTVATSRKDVEPPPTQVLGEEDVAEFLMNIDDE